MTINDAIIDIQELTMSFKSSFEAVDADQLNWKANPESWSIAQNLDHLIKINSSYFPAFEKIKEGTLKIPFLCRSEFLQSRFGDMILKSVLPENLKKTKTFPIWEASQSELPAGILQEFTEHHVDFVNKISELEEVVTDKTSINSPANKYIAYKFNKMLDIIIAHEQRHLKQALEVLKMIKQ
jgi:hypothetical protein